MSKLNKLPTLSGVAVLCCVMAGPAAGRVPGYEVVNDETALDETPVKQLRVACPKGKKAMGSGWAVLDKTDAILDGVALTNQPSFDGQSWLVNARNDSAFAKIWKLKVWVTCATVKGR
ncbi:MAG: hypothetical protein AAFW83_02670 [Pseudomonadota bacterium]